MANAYRDQNNVPTLIAVSNADGQTPVRLWADPITHRLLVDNVGGVGTVTSVSVVTANGFSGTVANATTTPAITLTFSRLINTTAPLAGGGALTSDLTLTTSVGSGKLMGRTTAGQGTMEEITPGEGLTLASQVLDITAGIFETISVSGQPNVVAESPTDTLTLIAGRNISITTHPLDDAITIDSDPPLGGIGIEGLTGTIDGNNTVFTVQYAPVWITVQGQTMIDGDGYTLSGLTVTFDDAPQIGNKLHGFYNGAVSPPASAGNYLGLVSAITY